MRQHSDAVLAPELVVHLAGAGDCASAPLGRVRGLVFLGWRARRAGVVVIAARESLRGA